MLTLRLMLVYWIMAVSVDEFFQLLAGWSDVTIYGHSGFVNARRKEVPRPLILVIGVAAGKSLFAISGGRLVAER